MTEEVKVPAAKPKAPAKPTPERKTSEGLRVKVTGSRNMVQPSTGTIIYIGDETLIENDGWAQNQLNAGLLEKV